MPETRESTFHFEDGSKKTVNELARHLEPNSKARVEQLEMLIGLSLDITDKLCDMMKELCTEPNMVERWPFGH